MSNPFGTSNQGGYQGPPTSTQAAPQQGFGGGAGYGDYGGFGGFGGFQSQPSYGGFGGFNPMFGGLGGLGFNPMMGMGFMQPMPFFGGFGGGYGGFGGFGGGFSPYQQPQFNPMFGGLGGLGFNPMMGGQFMQPMQKFDPYQQQMFQPRGLNFDDSPMGVRPDFTRPAGFVEEAAQQNFPSMDMRYRGGLQMSPEMRQRREQDMRNMERMAQQPVQQPVDTSIDTFKNSQAYSDYINTPGMQTQDMRGIEFAPTPTGPSQFIMDTWAKNPKLLGGKAIPGGGVFSPKELAQRSDFGGFR